MSASIIKSYLLIWGDLSFIIYWPRTDVQLPLALPPCIPCAIFSASALLGEERFTGRFPWFSMNLAGSLASQEFCSFSPMALVKKVLHYIHVFNPNRATTAG